MEYRRDRLIEEFPADVALIKDAYIKWRDKADQPRG